MKLPIYQVDAFTNKVFKGNPAAVIPLNEWLDDATLLNLALENNLSETAFYIPFGDDFKLRWFTPGLEVDLCGHATLATAHVLFAHKNYQPSTIRFHTRSGILTVKKEGDHYTMVFPKDDIKAIDPMSELQAIFQTTILETYKGKTDYMIVLPSQTAVTALTPNFHLLGKLDARGVIATAKGDETDFVSRCFYTPCGVDEDPVTGSAHTTMTPYWAVKLGKNQLSAHQLSARSGYIDCGFDQDKVILKGKAVTYMIGEIYV